jgi:ASCH domain
MSTATKPRTVLFSIKPVYADKILAGQKTVELRRRFPEAGLSGSMAMIYCTSPVKAVVGSAQIRSVYKLPLTKLWTSHGSAACIAKELARLIGRDILQMQGSQLILRWLVIAAIVNRPSSPVNWRSVFRKGNCAHFPSSARVEADLVNPTQEVRGTRRQFVSGNNRH